MSDALMKFCPATRAANPYPSHARQWRKYHGKTAWIYNPWSGAPRDPRDIGTDVFGILIEAKQALETFKSPPVADKWQDNGFSYEVKEKPRVFLQWKGTDACFDFHCKCGAHCHFDGYFAYTVKCPHCETIYEMPFMLFPREINEDTMEHWRQNPKTLEPDEDVPPLPEPPVAGGGGE